jgi:hypothetical protein
VPRRDDFEDDWDDADEDDDSSTIRCPYCRRQIHEDSERCPHCERYISEADGVPRRKPWWLIAGVSLGLFAVYRWLREM